MPPTVRVYGLKMKRIPSFPQYYAAENGRIYRLGTDEKRVKCPKPLRYNYGNTYGYPSLRLWDKTNRKVVSRYAHFLIAEAWLGPRPEGLEIHHRDGNHRNPEPKNLRYLSQADHLRAHGFRILTDDEVRQIRGSDLTDKQLALAFDIRPLTVNRVRNRRTYKNVA